MSEYAIEIENISKFYKSSLALKNINLKLRLGDIFGLIGQNGAGKTTLIKILLGFSKQSSGNVKILDKANSVSIRNKIGYLPEKVVIHSFFTPIEFLYYMGKLFSINSKNLNKEIPILLEKVGLADKQKEKIGNFSKGMTQRLGLAQALLNKPEILILDEPGSGLDPTGLIDLRNIILNENKERNTTIFFNSHRLLEAEQLCDKIAILHKGELVASGSMNELTKKKNQILLKVSEINSKVLDFVTGISLDMKQVGDIIYFEPKPEIDLKKIPKQVVELDSMILKYEIQNENLEEVFLRVTGEK